MATTHQRVLVAYTSSGILVFVVKSTDQCQLHQSSVESNLLLSMYAFVYKYKCLVMLKLWLFEW